MIEVLYRWMDEDEPERCRAEKAITRKEISCDHCLGTIPKHTPVAKLTCEDGKVYRMHQDCALEGCSRPELFQGVFL